MLSAAVTGVGEESRVVLADPKEESALRRGGSARLRCRVDGGPDLFYHWYRCVDPQVTCLCYLI